MVNHSDRQITECLFQWTRGAFDTPLPGILTTFLLKERVNQDCEWLLLVLLSLPRCPPLISSTPSRAPMQSAPMWIHAMGAQESCWLGQTRHHNRTSRASKSPQCQECCQPRRNLLVNKCGVISGPCTTGSLFSHRIGVKYARALSRTLAACL